MDNQEFNEILDQQLLQTKNTLTNKADEYARGKDRLSNFKKISAMMGVTNPHALLGLVMKHIVALVDFVNDLDAEILQPQDRWDEKIGDIIAYMILLKALVSELRKEQNQPE